MAVQNFYKYSILQFHNNSMVETKKYISSIAYKVCVCAYPVILDRTALKILRIMQSTWDQTSEAKANRPKTLTETCSDLNNVHYLKIKKLEFSYRSRCFFHWATGISKNNFVRAKKHTHTRKELVSSWVASLLIKFKFEIRQIELKNKTSPSREVKNKKKINIECCYIKMLNSL